MSQKMTGQTASLRDYRLSPQSIICTVLSSPLPIDRIYYGEVADVLYQIREKKVVDTSRMLMYMNAAHAHSEELSRLVAMWNAFDYATDYSPIKLTNDGRDLCEKIVREEKGESQNQKTELEKLEKALSKYTFDNGKITLNYEEEKPKLSLWERIFS